LSNADLLFSTGYPLARLAQGAFAEALSHLYWRITGKSFFYACGVFFYFEKFVLTFFYYLPSPGEMLEWMACGKPTNATYAHADTMLQSQHQRLLTEVSHHDYASQPTPGTFSAGVSLDQPIARTYGIGDNPYADIAGANRAGDDWSSVFVQTGTIARGVEEYAQPDLEYATVYEAVKAITDAHARGCGQP
jgi:ribonucleotide monophosphatase NagD (HAD superfamily)